MSLRSMRSHRHVQVQLRTQVRIHMSRVDSAHLSGDWTTHDSPVWESSIPRCDPFREARLTIVNFLSIAAKRDHDSTTFVSIQRFEYLPGFRMRRGLIGLRVR